MLFSGIEIIHNNRNSISIIGLNASTFIQDVARIYKYNLDPNERGKSKLFFKIVVNGVLFKRASITFHRYFLFDMYLIFEKLADITDRSTYHEVCELLKKEPDIEKHFEPMLKLPADITTKLDSLNPPLFPFQKHFIESYYNARNKLHLDGFILSFLAGGGKTFTAVATSYVFNLTPAIITAPKSTLDGWKDSIIRMYGKFIKENEVKILSEYNPIKDKVKWKFLICNYERLDQALEYSTYASSKPKLLVIDEAHNFRHLNTSRVKSLLNLKESLNIHNVIAISATPIKALGIELIPIMKLIDPEFNDTAEALFKKIYGHNNYDNITGSTLKNKLAIYMERYTDNSSLKLPPLEQYNVNVKLKDPTPYLIETVKDKVFRYVQDNLQEMRDQVKPNFLKIQQLLSNKLIASSVPKKDIDKYIELITLKMNHPLDPEAIEGMNIVKEFEQNTLKPIAPDITKEIIVLRKKAVYYTAILLGKAMGQYFIGGKINLLIDMVRENVDEFIKIIKSGEMKTIIFATFAQPLEPIKKILEDNGIGCIIHVGGMNVEETRDQFKNDNNIQVLLATSQSVGTGTDGYQFIANQIIFMNTSFRYTDVEQNIARVHRKGSPASNVKIYFMHLDTTEPNILERESDILTWSREIVRLAIDY